MSPPRSKRFPCCPIAGNLLFAAMLDYASVFAVTREGSEEPICAVSGAAAR
jgi:hypothetical protein